MLFISPHPLYQLLGITDEEPVYHPTNGRLLKTVPGINAEFFHGGAPNWALDQALSNPMFKARWNALPDGVNYSAYVSSFDTEAQQIQHGWDDETREFVEEFMLNYSDYGLHYIKAEEPQEIRNLPWPNFNETHHAKVAIYAKEGGYDLQAVLDYERQNKARPLVIERLEQALAENPQVEEELVPA